VERSGKEKNNEVGGMKMKWCVLGSFLLVIFASVQLDAQQADAERKSFGEDKDKAEKGDAVAQFNLANDYLYGRGVTQDKAEAMEWYRKAAKQNVAPAQYNLGCFYRDGINVVQDYFEAVKWYRKAAEQHLAEAEAQLGSCYHDGLGVTKDEVEAVNWDRKAAEQGYAAAQCDLGTSYFIGDGVEKDYKAANEWLLRSANQGFVYAQLKMGGIYEEGSGVPQDYIQAYKWFNLAAGQGDTNAVSLRLFISQKMTSDQISEAQRLTRGFKPRKESGYENSASSENPTASGTGFFITDDGYLISNYHVVKGATRIRLVTSAETIDAKVVQVDAANDLALLKAVGRFASLPILPSRSAHLGGTVATIGFPDPSLQGFSPKLAKGEIASLSGAADDPHYFQISVPVQPGNSGGALVDERGNVIGIVSAKLDASVALAASGALPENVNYAVKSSLLLSFLESVPEVSAKLKAPNTADEKFEDVVKSAQDAAVLVLVY
jgi:TPR repeat protein